MEEANKDIKDMDVDEILRQQVELLAERSKQSIDNNELSQLTHSMVEICSLFPYYRP